MAKEPQTIEAADLRARLERLPERWRKVLWLRAQDLTTVEVAQAMGLSRQRIHQLERRALKELRAMYGVEGQGISVAKATSTPRRPAPSKWRENKGRKTLMVTLT